MSKELEVRQHNALTNARYEYTELQMDLLFFILSRLRKEQQSVIYELPIQDLSKLTGKQYNLTYLRKATEDMGSRMFEIETPERVKQFWLFNSVEYLIGQGTIKIKLAEDILPFLFDLKNNFTSFELLSALRLTSKHAKRIYTVCSQWKNLGETKKYSISDFKRMLGLIKQKGKEVHEEYTEITMFKKFVLDVAVKQINEHTDLHISYKLEKQGRSFSNLFFTVKPQSLATTIPFDLVEAPPVKGLTPHQVESAARLLKELNITSTDIVQLILSTPAHIIACNKFAHDMKTGKVKVRSSSAGLLLVTLGIKKPASSKIQTDTPQDK